MPTMPESEPLADWERDLLAKQAMIDGPRPKLSVLYLPGEGDPFALVLYLPPGPFRDQAAAELRESLAEFGRQCGARATLIVPFDLEV